MTADKHNIAHRYAHIMKTIGAQAQSGDDVLALLNLAVKNGLSALYAVGCDAFESNALLADALRHQLSSSEATNPKCREVLHMGLFVFGR